MSGIGRTAGAELPEHNFHPAYRADIDGLRALAILAVIAFHAFPKSLRSGYTGVNVFFVISGFLISSIVFKSLVRGDFSFREFYSHRIKRIFPALLVVLASCYAIGWFVLLPGEFMQLGKHLVAGIGFVQNFVLWTEVGYFDSASEFKPLLHLWSLSVEEQFYLFYPLIIWGAWRSGLSILMILVVLGLVSFGMNIEGVRRDATMAFFLPHTRFWELLAGGLIAYIYLFNYQDHLPAVRGAVPRRDGDCPLGPTSPHAALERVQPHPRQSSTTSARRSALRPLRCWRNATRPSP